MNDIIHHYKPSIGITSLSSHDSGNGQHLYALREYLIAIAYSHPSSITFSKEYPSFVTEFFHLETEICVFPLNSST